MHSKIIAINIGISPVELKQFYQLEENHPHANTVSEIVMLCFCIAHGDRLIMIDAAALPTGELAEAFPMNEPTPQPLLEQLADMHITAERVTDVIITHTHWDHYNGLTHEVEGKLVPAFPNARHIIHAADWNPDTFEALEKSTLQVVGEYGLVSLIEGRFEIADGLTIIPAPGETPGHQIIELIANGKPHYFCGDLFHHEVEFDDFSLNVPWAEPITMGESKKAILTIAAENGGMLYFSHIDGAFLVEQNGEAFLFSKQK